MSYRPIQRLIFTLLMNHENYHHGRRSRGGPGIRTPHFMTVWGPHAGGPPLFGCIHKIFYCRFDKNARKCYITRRVKHCRDSKWCHELVQLMVTSSNDIKIMTSFTYLFECNADTSCTCSCKKHGVHCQNWIVPVWLCGWWYSRLYWAWTGVTLYSFRG